MSDKILMVLTSHDRFGETGEKTGFWLEEFAAPYYVFQNADAEITIASPQGGQKYQKTDAFAPFVLTDGHLITGQNPASSEPAAEATLAALNKNA